MADCAITIASDSSPYKLLVISDPSDTISTSLRSFLLIFYLPLPFEKNNIVPRSPHLHKISYHLDLTRTAFYCVLRHYPSYLDLDTLHSTSFYCDIPIILHFSSYWFHFDLARLFVIYIGLQIQTYHSLTHTLSDHY